VNITQFLQFLPLNFGQLLFQLLKSFVASCRAVKLHSEFGVIGRQLYQACLLDFGPGS
jgi:hypothetical protein